jgi:hypothetical protein
MPPVLDVAFDELPGRGLDQVRATEVRPRVEEREHVLQLIAEPERAAGLIRAAARSDATAQGLVDQPAVHDEIERVVRGPDLHDVEHVVPGALGPATAASACATEARRLYPPSIVETRALNHPGRRSRTRRRTGAGVDSDPHQYSNRRRSMSTNGCSDPQATRWIRCPT